MPPLLHIVDAHNFLSCVSEHRLVSSDSLSFSVSPSRFSSTRNLKLPYHLFPSHFLVLSLHDRSLVRASLTYFFCLPLELANTLSPTFALSIVALCIPEMSPSYALRVVVVWKQLLYRPGINPSIFLWHMFVCFSLHPRFVRFSIHPLFHRYFWPLIRRAFLTTSFVAKP